MSRLRFIGRVLAAMPDAVKRRRDRAAAITPPPVLAGAFSVAMRPVMGEFETGTPESARAMLAAYSPKKPPRGVLVEEVTVADLRCLRLSPRDANSEIPVVYVHGGGYTVGSPETHQYLAGQIAKVARRPMLLPEYRLAPEHPFPAALEDVMSVWEVLTKQYGSDAPISIAGDSAGGGLSLATMLRLRDRKLKLPARAVLISPWVDMTASGGSIDDHAKYDYLTGPLIEASAKAYLGENGDPKSPEASPLLAELEGLPPILIQIGGAETFLDQGIQLADRLHAAGVDVHRQVEPGMVHVWPSFGKFFEQSRAAIRRAGQFLRFD